MEQLNEFEVALFAAQAKIFRNKRNDPFTAAAFHTEDLCTHLALNLFLEFLSALRTHIGRLFPSFSHELSRCKLRVDC